MRLFIAPLILLSAYLFLLSFLLPGGINRDFSRTFLMVTACLVVASPLAFLMLQRLKPGFLTDYKVASDTCAWSDAILLFLPLTPVMQYLFLNQDILRWHDYMVIVALFSFAAALAILIVPQILRRWVNRSVALMLGLSLSFTMINMASLASYFSWHRSGNFAVEVGLFLLIFLLGLLIYRKDRQALNIAVIFYFVGTVAVFLSSSTASEEAAIESAGVLASKVERLTKGRQPEKTPDIFLLTYDSYVENATMLRYGIDNSEQEDFLEANGFNIHRGIYSLARASVQSMGRVLGEGDPQQNVAGNSPMLSVLQGAGYRTHGVFSRGYFFQGVDIGYDYAFPPPSASFLVITRAVAEGQFRHNVQFQKIPFDQFVDQKRAVMRSREEQPLFLYTHTGPGHTQNSGACLPNEVELFERKLDKANLEMRQDIAAVLESNRDAIIIVNGDHGPHLTKNCLGSMADDYTLDEITPLDLQDRFGSFLAIRWPEASPAEGRNIAILQDVFPAIFSYLYQDSSFEELRMEQVLARDAEGGIRGVTVRDGYIEGGSFDGQPLFKSEEDSANRR